MRCELQLIDDDDWIEVLDDKWAVGRVIERRTMNHWMNMISCRLC